MRKCIHIDFCGGLLLNIQYVEHILRRSPHHAHLLRILGSDVELEVVHYLSHTNARWTRPLTRDAHVPLGYGPRFVDALSPAPNARSESVATVAVGDLISAIVVKLLLKWLDFRHYFEVMQITVMIEEHLAQKIIWKFFAAGRACFYFCQLKNKAAFDDAILGRGPAELRIFLSGTDDGISRKLTVQLAT